MVRAMPKWRRLQGVLCESLEPVAGAGHAGGGLVPGGGRGRPGPGHSAHLRQVQVKVGDKATEMAARGAQVRAPSGPQPHPPHQNHEEGENCQPTEISTAAMWTKRALRTYTLTPRVHF